MKTFDVLSEEHKPRFQFVANEGPKLEGWVTSPEAGPDGPLLTRIRKRLFSCGNGQPVGVKIEAARGQPSRNGRQWIRLYISPPVGFDQQPRGP